MSEKNAPLGASNATKSRSTDAGKDTSVKNSQISAAKAETTGSGSHSSPKKRRKVNHACVYCRRSVSLPRGMSCLIAIRDRPCI
ncbi:hypothetical protein ACN42_g3966 [Penicillium freii]|uniref:Uncharacterized protein n=1 Tax=Penicillium freii TaxID=48697 RepID=A0A117NPZ0_PENFR|nr:hypothetical protein ACN42_g3966 [Penicillium freii]